MVHLREAKTGAQGCVLAFGPIAVFTVLRAELKMNIARTLRHCYASLKSEGDFSRFAMVK